MFFGLLFALPTSFTEDFQLRSNLLRVATTKFLILVV
jgi:hypothetical protein